MRWLNQRHLCRKSEATILLTHHTITGNSSYAKGVIEKLKCGGDGKEMLVRPYNTRVTAYGGGFFGLHESTRLLFQILTSLNHRLLHVTRYMVVAKEIGSI